MKHIFATLLLLCGLVPAGAQQPSGTAGPLIDRSLPDPTVLRAPDGYFYLYATENHRNLPIYRSRDYKDWQFVGTAFTDQTRPKWNPKGGIWAPDINYVDGKYLLYYSKSVWGGEWTCGIGVATADKPGGPFTDHGALFISKDIGVQNSIDQFFIEDNGHKYLFWGSFHGIYGIELTDDGLKVKPGAQKKQIAGGFMEATYIHKHGKYYYLFGSAGSCCEGNRSTYHVTYGRSENLFGPYLDKKGRRLLDGHYETLLHGNEVIAGPGHNAEFITDDDGTEWITYHGYKRSNPGDGRVVWIDRVEWVDGWPHVALQRHSSAGERPRFDRMKLADPTIFVDNGTYYLYGTSHPDGFKVYTSTDLKTWKVPAGAKDGLALRRGESWGTQGFWAPQVFKHKGKYYMIYTANEQIAIAEADSPVGPFRQKKLKQMPAKTKQIDPFVFFDTDGKAYLYHVRLINGNRIYVAELNKDLRSVKEKTAREVANADDFGWEHTWKNNGWNVCEGPTVIKLDDTYYLFYSANDFRNPDYAVGYATSKSPLGPFVKHKQPVISRRLIGEDGTGHGDLFKNKEGKWEYVFHVHRGNGLPTPRKTAIVTMELGKYGWEIVEGSFRELGL